METVEERPIINTTTEVVKPNAVEENNVDVEETKVCHKSNGVDCEKKNDDQNVETNDVEWTDSVKNSSGEAVSAVELSEKNDLQCTQDCDIPTNVDTVVVESVTDNENEVPRETEVTDVTEVTQVVEVTTEHVIEVVEKVPCDDNHVNDLETVVSEQVHFETEILVEKNDNDLNENLLIDNQENDSTGNILSELGPNIELSEVLRSSDISENNNSAVRQEVFNKEELLDILEGNDVQETVDKVVQVTPVSQSKMLEAQIAMQQLSRLKHLKKKKSNTSRGRKSDKKEDKKAYNTEVVKSESQTNTDNAQTKAEVKSETSPDKTNTDNIVNVLVMDWQDDEPVENVSDEVIVETEILLKETEDIKEAQEQIVSTEESNECASVDSTMSEEQSQKSSKNEDENAPRRLSRVIKKKVIFDPDNPDTFTKGKSTTKVKDVQVNKDQVSSKKIKLEQTPHRSKSKSPLSKLQWKKPSPRNSKQCKRLSEVDKLLMDEGAVNMIYQLTPEAPKGRKNMKTKAEFIKKIQSSTPDGKEMKFRERKKESLRYEDGEAKRILGGKPRMSLSSSVKSPTVSEDFETHSADDSIIYRRHSSSSYSSSCMSPRRLSDVETGSGQNVQRQSRRLASTDNKSGTKSVSNLEGEDQTREVFKTEGVISTEIINKDDCLSIKEKLNSKLSLALNKRKRDSSKLEKPSKIKKIVRTEDTLSTVEVDRFQFITITIDQRLATISIKKSQLKMSVEVLKEMVEALNYVDSKEDISVTLLVSQCGAVSSNLDLSTLLEENNQIRANNAFELAESVRAVLGAAWRHGKLLVVGARGECSGPALALLALGDVALADERASFALSAPLLPGAAALAQRRSPLSQPLVNDLLIFGRRLSAAEALQGGLVGRVLWPDRFDEQVYNIAKDIASQPIRSVLLKKKLLTLKKNNETELTFLTCLEAERDLLVEYWTSVEGQELLRATQNEA